MSSKKFPKWLIEEYIIQINKEIFSGFLPVNELKITQKLKGNDALAFYSDYEIELNPSLMDCSELFFTLGHELIHFYQDILEIPTNHNGKFFRFFGKKIKETYDYKFPFNAFVYLEGYEK
jgi:predicted SprT family Zn-dependent metalloprotease